MFEVGAYVIEDVCKRCKVVGRQGVLEVNQAERLAVQDCNFERLPWVHAG